MQKRHETRVVVRNKDKVIVNEKVTLPKANVESATKLVKKWYKDYIDNGCNVFIINNYLNVVIDVVADKIFKHANQFVDVSNKINVCSDVFDKIRNNIHLYKQLKHLEPSLVNDIFKYRV